MHTPTEKQRLEHFESQLKRIVTQLGGRGRFDHTDVDDIAVDDIDADTLERAARRLGVSRRTLTRWLEKPPTTNYAKNLSRSDEVAAREIPGYPEGAGDGKTLYELALGRPADPEDTGQPSSAEDEAASGDGDGAAASGSGHSRGWLKPFAAGAALVLAVALVLSAGSRLFGGEQGSEPGSSEATAEAGQPTTASAGEVVPGTLPPRPGLTVEVAAGLKGAPVYSDATGAVVPSDVTDRIPYGTAVYVSCKEPNRSGMTSVASFYRIVDGEWDGLVAVSNGFQNGDEFGITGGRVVNEAIPDCS